MKPIKFFALVGIFTTISIVLPAVAEVRQQASFPQGQNYVVIGAFAIHKNAIRFTSHASSLHLSAKFEMNPHRNLYYVYVLNTEDREQAIQQANKLRSETEFTDTWVYSGAMGEFTGGGEESRGMDINPVTQSKMESVPADRRSQQLAATGSATPDTSFSNHGSSTGTTLATASSGESQAPGSTPVTGSQNESTTGEQTTNPGVASSSIPDGSDEIQGKNFLFTIFRSDDNAQVEGDIDIVDNEKLKKVGTYKGNMPVKISSPGNKSGTVTLVCEVFGYRKVQKDVNYSNPEGEGITEENGSIRVPFELVRLQKGDIAVMYNVYFFKDAAVMRPESRFEINSLLDMLKENPKYKIKIHGHTNGGSHGKIVSIGDSKNFFSLTGTKEGFGSAKKLSEERAKLIHEYLTTNGIQAHRTHVKAWGGKRPIHDKHSSRASENVRVEIEILEN